MWDVQINQSVYQKYLPMQACDMSGATRSWGLDPNVYMQFMQVALTRARRSVVGSKETSQQHAHFSMDEQKDKKMET